MSAPNIAFNDSSSERPPSGSDYRFEHLNLGLFLQDVRFSRTALVPGDRLPEATLVNLDGREVSLRSLAAGRPIALVTGSTTCPATASAMPDLKGLEERNFYQYYTPTMEELWQPMFLFMALGIQAN